MSLALYAPLLLVAALPSATPAQLPLKLPSGQALTVEVMERDEDRARGLMFRNSLPQDRALLFVFARADLHAIWMKNCKFPIDIVWLDAQRRVVSVQPDAPPCERDPCPIYKPSRRAIYVVELNAGQAARGKATVGSRFEFKLER